MQTELHKVKFANVKPLVYKRLLKVGVRGDDVKALQEVLKLLGYLEIDNCTTYYGSMTKEAVMKLQGDYGILVDGIAGSQTINTINDIIEGKIRGCSKTPSRGSTEASSIEKNSKYIKISRETL